MESLIHALKSNDALVPYCNLPAYNNQYLAMAWKEASGAWNSEPAPDSNSGYW
jgi:hypothetical protein